MLIADLNPYLPAPPFVDSGDTAWQLTAATFVGLQSIPGLAMLYAGLVKKKWALNSAMMSFYAFAAVLVTWVLWGYSMSFGNPLFSGALQGLIGMPHPTLDVESISGQANIPLASGGTPPLRFAGSAMIYFQFVFAAISPILVLGSVLGRINFKAWMLFVPLWSTFSYSLCAFMLWGGGFLSQLGAVDFSGGYVIHLAAGVSGFVAAAMIGPRLAQDRTEEPNNLIMALAGAGLLWLGWNGFNGGGPYFAGHSAALAVLTTNIATATALFCWFFLDMFFTGKASPVSMINGMICGLVAITPAAGYVDGYGAFAIGIASGLIPWFTFNQLGKWSVMQKVDDVLGVLHVHAIAGLVGGLMIGLVANPNVIVYLSSDRKTSPISVAGLFYGAGTHQLLVQLAAALVVIAVNVVMTFLILKIISLFVPLRASEEELQIGDVAIHGVDPMPMPAFAVGGMSTMNGRLGENGHSEYVPVAISIEEKPSYAGVHADEDLDSDSDDTLERNQ